MKHFLKSTVSLVVLLSAFSTFTPIQAIEDEEDASGSQQKTSTPAAKPLPLAKLLSPLGQEELQPPHFDIRDREAEDPLSPSPMTQLPPELAQCFMPFLEESGLKGLHGVSTFLLSLSLEERKKRILQWEEGDESEGLLDPFFTHAPYIVHPSHLLWLHEMLKSKALLYPPSPTSTLRSRLDPPTIITAEEEVPEIIRKFALLVGATPEVYPLLCRIYLNNIDFLDIRGTCLAAYVVNQVPGIKALLEQVERELRFEPYKLLVVAKNLTTHQRLKQYFMALKLLALGGDKSAEKQTKSLSEWMTHLLNSVDSESFATTSSTTHPRVLGHPLWGACLAHGDSLFFQWMKIFSEWPFCPPRVNTEPEFLQLVSSHLLEKHRVEPLIVNPDLLKAFMEYTTIVDEACTKPFKECYNYSLLQLYIDKNDSLNISNLLKSIQKGELLCLIKAFPYSGRVLLVVRKWLGEDFHSLDVKIRTNYLDMLLAKALSGNSEGQQARVRETLRSLDNSEVLLFFAERQTGGTPQQYRESPLGRRWMGNDAHIDPSLIDIYSEFSQEGPILISSILKEAHSRFNDDFRQFKFSRKACILYLTYLLKQYYGNHDQQSISDLLKSLTDNELKDFITPFYYNSTYFGSNEEAFTKDKYNLCVLEEAEKRLPYSPLHINLKLNLAIFNLLFEDKEHIAKAEGYLKSVNNLIQIEKKEYFDSIFASKSQEEIPQDKSNEPEEKTPPRKKIKPSWSNLPPQGKLDDAEPCANAFMVGAALRIYQGQFQEAIRDLNSLLFIPYRSPLQELVFKALKNQLQYPDLLSDELISRIGHSFFELIFKATSLEHFYTLSGSLSCNNYYRDNERNIYRYEWFFREAIRRGLLQAEVFEEIYNDYG